MSVQDNLKNRETWLRALFIVLFWIVLLIFKAIIEIIALVLLLIVLFTGKRNSFLQGLGNGLSTYVYQILMFMTFNSDVKPFPFTPFPSIKLDAAEPVSKPNQPE